MLAKLELSDLLKQRRMCREFDPVPIEREKLEELIVAGNRTPQGGNVSVREFIIVDDPNYVRLVRAITPSFVANAPAIIVILTDLSKALEAMGVQGREVLSLLDAGAAAENIALKAIELGLAVSFARSATTKALMHILKIPEKYRIDLLIGVGYTSKSGLSEPAKGQTPVIHRNTYGGSL